MAVELPEATTFAVELLRSFSEMLIVAPLLIESWVAKTANRRLSFEPVLSWIVLTALALVLDGAKVVPVAVKPPLTTISVVSNEAVVNVTMSPVPKLRLPLSVID